MAQHLNEDDAKNQGNVHHTPSSSKEPQPTKITTESSHLITMTTPKPNEEILITAVRGFKDLPKVPSTRTSLRTACGGNRYVIIRGKLLVCLRRCFSAIALCLPYAYNERKNLRSCRRSSHSRYCDEDESERDSNDEKGDTEEEENRPGSCKTSGNQIFFDVEIGVSPPKSPTPPPRNEPKGLSRSISPKQVDPGSDSKINGCFSWRKRKRLQPRATISSKRVECTNVPDL